MNTKVLKKIAAVFFLTAALIGTASAQQLNNAKYNISSQSKLYIDGTSTLHSFKVNAQEIKGDLSLQNTAGQADGRVKISRLKVVIPVKKLDTDEKSMNENMDKALKADKNPDITYSLNNVNAFNLSSDSAKPDIIKTTGTLTIAGVSQDIQMEVKGYRAEDGTLHFTGEKEVNMVDYGVEPPTMFFGAIRVGKNVKVYFDLVLTAQNELVGSK